MCHEDENKFKCDDNFNYESCGSVPNALHKNNGCKHQRSETYQFFQCANRMDKENVLFKRPLNFARLKEATINLNTELSYTNSSFFCGGDRHIAFKDLKTVLKIDNSSDNCVLKNNQTVNYGQLYRRLLTDFSFKESMAIATLL